MGDAMLSQWLRWKAERRYLRRTKTVRNVTVNFSTLETKIGFEKTSKQIRTHQGLIVFSTIFRNTSKKPNEQLQKPVSLTASCSSGRKGLVKALLRKMTGSTENKRRLTYKQFLKKYHRKVIQISPRNWNNTKVYSGCRRYKIETRNINSERKTQSVEIVSIKYIN